MTAAGSQREGSEVVIAPTEKQTFARTMLIYKIAKLIEQLSDEDMEKLYESLTKRVERNSENVR